jgi:hypothetical protein
MTDEFDDELREALQARTGGAVGTARAHDAVLGRAATIRRRRALTAGSGALAILVIGALVLVPRGGDDRIAPADDVTVPPIDTTGGDEDAGVALPTTTVDRDTDEASDDDQGTTGSTSTVPSTTTATSTTSTDAPRATFLDRGTVTTTGAPAAAPPASTGGSPTPPAATPGTTTATTPATTSATTVAPSTTVAPTTAATTNPTTTTDPPGTPPFTTTYSSSGGSITVDWNGTSLSLLAVQPAAGYTAEVEDQTSSRIRVRFRGDDDARIEIRADDGQVVEIIT